MPCVIVITIVTIITCTDWPRCFLHSFLQHLGSPCPLLLWPLAWGSCFLGWGHAPCTSQLLGFSHPYAWKGSFSTAEVVISSPLGCPGCRRFEVTHSWAPSDVVDGRGAGVSVRDHETEMQEGEGQAYVWTAGWMWDFHVASHPILLV